MPESQISVVELVGRYQDALGRGENPNPDAYRPADPARAAEFDKLLAADDVLKPSRSSDTEDFGPDGTEPDLPPNPPGLRIVRKLGRGGMGDVFEAIQLSLNRTVALKTIRGDRDGRARFLAEAAAAAGAKHPNVVEVYDFGEADRRAYLVMELLPGGTLAERLDGGKALSPAEAIATLMPVAAAVHSLHVRQIIHRDLKPGNVMFDGDGVPKVTDFGLARHAARETLTAEGATPGTPAYMAPEQVAATGDFVGPAADVWALGVTLYECLAGRRPFQGKTTGELFTAIERADPRPLPSTVSPDLARVCLACLEKKPADRYESARALHDDLVRVSKGEPVSVRPLSMPARVVRWCTRNKVAAGLIASLVVGSVSTAALATAAVRQANRRVETEGKLNEETTARILDDYSANVQIALEQGNVIAARDLVSRASAAGVKLTTKMKLAEVDSFAATGETERAVGIMEAIPITDVPESERAKWLVRHGDLLMMRDTKRGVEYLHRAQHMGIPDVADRELVSGILANDAVRALGHFEAALKADPRQLRAREYETILLIFLGRIDRARRLAEDSNLLFPEHPSFPVCEAFCRLLREESPKDRVGLELLMKGRAPNPFTASVQKIYSLISVALAIKPDPANPLALLSKVNQVRSMITTEPISKGTVFDDPPPCFSVMGELVGAVNLSKLMMNIALNVNGETPMFTDVELEKLTAIAERHPLPELRLFVGIELYSRAFQAESRGKGRDEKTISLYRGAADQFKATMNAECLFRETPERVLPNLFLCRLYGGWPPHDPKMRNQNQLKEAAALVSEFRKFPNLWPRTKFDCGMFFPAFVWVYQKTDDWNGVRDILIEWERIDPGNGICTAYRAILAARTGDDLTAYRAAGWALMHRSYQGPELEGIYTNARARLREQAQSMFLDGK